MGGGYSTNGGTCWLSDHIGIMPYYRGFSPISAAVFRQYLVNFIEKANAECSDFFKTCSRYMARYSPDGDKELIRGGPDFSKRPSHSPFEYGDIGFVFDGGNTGNCQDR